MHGRQFVTTSSAHDSVTFVQRIKKKNYFQHLPLETGYTKVSEESKIVRTATHSRTEAMLMTRSVSTGRRTIKNSMTDKKCVAPEVWCTDNKLLAKVKGRGRPPVTCVDYVSVSRTQSMNRVACDNHLCLSTCEQRFQQCEHGEHGSKTADQEDDVRRKTRDRKKQKIENAKRV